MQEVGQVVGKEVGSEARARHVPTHDKNLQKCKKLVYNNNINIDSNILKNFYIKFIMVCNFFFISCQIFRIPRFPYLFQYCHGAPATWVQ
jgi:hypothetical protein